jgi:hypothetical protein
MPLLPAFYTTTNFRKRKQRKHDRSEHDAWLINMGVSPQQIKAKKTKNTSWKTEYAEGLKVDRSTKEHDSHSVIASNASAAANRSIMSNLHKEPEHVREAILAKAKRVMPLYNKGGLQVLTESDDLKALNKVAR